MSPRFGTSGLRGLVTELTPALVSDHTRAFLRACPTGGGLHLGRDLRASSPALAAVVSETARGEGVPVTDCGELPTPALALAALTAGQAAIMVTGSHIPDDRNGLKFYTPQGEITKADEAAILAALGGAAAGRTAQLHRDSAALAAYAARFRTAYDGALAGLRIGIWQQSSVARDLLGEVLAACGAEIVPLGRSDIFLPVDTEAVAPDWRSMFAAWAAEHRLDALVSTDGDADRPLLADEAGRVIPGDILGALTALALGAERVVTTVSANTCVDLTGRFTVVRTRIGSPYVIAAMAETQGGGRTVGYEPNGGFLLGFAAQGPSGALPPLPTRDCLLPILAPLSEARARGLTLSALAAGLPARFTASERLQGVAPGAAAAFLARLEAESTALLTEAGLSEARTVDRTDGWRAIAATGEILHLRPSGNAPEFRIYAEAGTAARAEDIAARAAAAVTRALASASPG